MHTTQHPARGGQALMVAGSLLLGTLGVFVHESGQHWLVAVGARCAFGALALGAWAAASGRLPQLRLQGRALHAALAAGVLMVLNWSLFFAAMAHVPIGLATLVVHAQPFWVMALAALWLHEPVGHRQVGAAAVAMVGLVLASGVAGAGTAGGGGTPVAAGLAVGLSMCLAASFTYAVVTLIAKGAGGASPLALAWWQCVVGTALVGAMLAGSGLIGQPLVQGAPAGAAAWAWLAGLGVLHTGLAYVLMYEGMARLPAERIAVLQFVYPGAALLVDWAVYGQALVLLQSAGVALMTAALWASRRPAGD